MRKPKITLLTLSLLSAFNLHASQVCKQEFGSLYCGRGEIDVIDFRGKILIDGTVVTKSIHALGNMTVTNATINNTEITGHTVFEHITATGNFNINGSIAAEDVIVYGKTNIHGSMAATRVKFLSDAKLIGDAAIDSCLFKSQAILVGKFKVNNTQFEKNIFISTKESKFLNTRANDIEVLRPSDGQEQVIVLSANTKVHKVIFENGRGKVVLKDHASINAVEGGQIIRN